MSHRALRKLREEQLATAADAPSESEEEDDSSSDGGGGVGFAGLMDSDSESESESESESDAEEEDKDEPSHDGIDADTKEPDLKDEEDDGKDENEEEEEEDLDAILSEFQSTSVSAGNTAGPATSSITTTAANATAAFLTNLDSRDLDLERSMGSLLGGGGGMGNLGLNNAAAEDDDNAPQLNRMHPAMRGRNQRGMRTHVMGGRSSAPTGGRKFVFGKPGETCGRPPSYIGGGLGMDVKGAEELGRSQGLPWPYSTLDDESTIHGPNLYRSARWHSFTRSDSYAAQSAEYEHVAASGDVNALALFVADNPYHAEASLQLCSVLQPRVGHGFAQTSTVDI